MGGGVICAGWMCTKEDSWGGEEMCCYLVPGENLVENVVGSEQAKVRRPSILTEDDPYSQHRF